MRYENDAMVSRCLLRRENRQAQLVLQGRNGRFVFCVWNVGCGGAKLQPGTDHADSRFTKRLACSWVQGLREGFNGDATTVQQEESASERDNEGT
jgi:hypothetical protein